MLVVDDAPENLVAIRAALDDLKNELVLAGSGKEALRHLLERDFALILLDVQMPSMSGLETARLIRQRERSRHVPIVFITAHDRDHEDVLAAYRLGAVDFLFKPIDPEILRAKASVFVELQRRSAEVARQAQLIREQEEEGRARALAEQRRRLEAEAMRQSLINQKKYADELTRANGELELIRSQLVESNARLASDDQRKDEFIAVLAHELRNPLAALTSGLELIDSADDLTAAKRVMERQCTHLSRLVDDLLDVSRITSNKLNLNRERVALGDVLDDAVKLATPGIAEQNHALVIDCSEPEAVIDGDPVRLAQIVANLLTNAARYTESGGEIQLSAGNRGDRIVITVKDNGRGLSAGDLENIFDMFVQASGDGGGLGLGLTLVRKLAAMHGGTVSARSEGPGQGSEFELDLPVAGVRNGRPEVAPAAAEAVATDRLLRIALIDDHDDLREMTRRILEKWGHTVLEAACGEAGIALVLAERPDIAVVDIGLPDMPGYDVAKRVRETMGRDSPAMIAMTGYGQDKDRDDALRAGFNIHLPKPAKADALKAAINGALEAANDSALEASDD